MKTRLLNADVSSLIVKNALCKRSQSLKNAVFLDRQSTFGKKLLVFVGVLHIYFSVTGQRQTLAHNRTRFTMITTYGLEESAPARSF